MKTLSRIIANALIVFAVVATGCTQSNGTVSGKVSYKGQPITFGRIAFEDEKGQVVNAPINKGAYTAANVPVGPAKVMVQSFAPPPQTQIASPTESQNGAAPAAASPGPFEPTPDRYANASESGLTLDVKPGEQTKDFELTP